VPAFALRGFGEAGNMADTVRHSVVRFGAFELDLEAERLLKNGRQVRLQPQPFKVLRLLVNQPGKLVTREEIQGALWTNETFVDFEQGVNFAIKQVREALGDRADNSIYVETVPKRGYRFLAPVVLPASDDTQELRVPAEPFLQRALWENIVELRLSEEQHRKQLRMMAAAIVCLAIACVALFLLRT
jgi:DNA-binding winged helix-turn-helix (wHTH) protein